jgi:hypothetical protein
MNDRPVEALDPDAVDLSFQPYGREKSVLGPYTVRETQMRGRDASGVEHGNFQSQARLELFMAISSK